MNSESYSMDRFKEEIIEVRVKPGSSRNEVKETPYGFEVKLTSSPEKGRANEHLIEILSGHFGVKKSNIKIKTGHSSRKKLIVLRRPA